MECPKFEDRECRYAECFSDIHHLYFPGNMFKTMLERTFRELPINKREELRCEHDEIHAKNEPPEKPDIPTMRSAVVEAYEAGEVYLSKRKIKKLGLN